MLTPKRIKEILTAHREADSVRLEEKTAYSNAGKSQLALEKLAENWSYTSTHAQQGKLAEGVREILAHPYCEKGTRFRERLTELFTQWQADLEATRAAGERTRALPSLMEMRNEVFGVLSDAFNARVKAIYDRVYPLVRTYCVDDDWGTADEVADQLVNQLPRLKLLHLARKNVERGQNATRDIGSMIAFIQELDETRESDLPAIKK
jgi:hypothetical protein